MAEFFPKLMKYIVINTRILTLGRISTKKFIFKHITIKLITKNKRKTFKTEKKGLMSVSTKIMKDRR